MYYFESKIRYSELNRQGELSPEALLNYYQDVSTFHSESVGMGPEYLAAEGLGWVLVYWQIVIERFPHLGEAVRIGTAPYDFKGVMGYRNFIMETKEGERLSCANTIWTLMDIKKQRPTKAGEQIKAAYVLEDPLPMNYVPRKIMIPESEPMKREAVIVQRHHLDTNGHVNNVQYIKIAAEYLPDEFQIGQARVEYKNQAHQGNRIMPVIYRLERDDWVIVLESEDGKPYCILELLSRGHNK